MLRTSVVVCIFQFSFSPTIMIGICVNCEIMPNSNGHKLIQCNAVNKGKLLSESDSSNHSALSWIRMASRKITKYNPINFIISTFDLSDIALLATKSGGKQAVDDI